jgi:hypothetical protein
VFAQNENRSGRCQGIQVIKPIGIEYGMEEWGGEVESERWLRLIVDEGESLMEEWF